MAARIPVGPQLGRAHGHPAVAGKIRTGHMVGIRSQAAHVIGADEKHGTDGQGAVVRAVQDQLGHLVAQFRIHGRKRPGHPAPW